MLEKMDIGGQSTVNCDFTICIIRCDCVSCRINTWQIVYPSYKGCIRIPDPVLQYKFIEVRLRYINIPRAPWNLRELPRFSCQLQASSARASHFLDAETCEFPSLTLSMAMPCMVPVISLL